MSKTNRLRRVGLSEKTIEDVAPFAAAVAIIAVIAGLLMYCGWSYAPLYERARIEERAHCKRAGMKESHWNDGKFYCANAHGQLFLFVPPDCNQNHTSGCEALVEQGSP